MQTITDQATTDYTTPLSAQANQNFPTLIQGKAYPPTNTFNNVSGGKSPLVYSSGPLPTGMSIDPTTGIVSGTPTDAPPAGDTITFSFTLSDSSK